jgi:hypothetical protein
MRLKEMLLTRNRDVQTTEIPSASRGQTEIKLRDESVRSI